MQRARLAVRPDAVVIEDAIGNVGMLLDFAQGDAGTNRVRRPGRHENGVTRMNRHACKTILRGTIDDGALKRLSCHVRIEPHAHRRSLARADNVPHLGFPDASGPGFVLLRICIVGMHLHGKFFFRKNKFHEQRNARQPAQSRPSPFLRQRRPHLAQRAPRKFARGKHAFVARQPCFADRFRFLGAFWKER